MTNQNRRATKRIIAILAAAAAVMVCCFLLMKRNCTVTIVEEESFFSGFEVIDNEVHIYCIVSLKNNSGDTKEVKLTGDFQKEAENGLLREGSLEAYFKESATDRIAIGGNSTVSYAEIEFVGEYAGNPSMSSRALPDIDITETGRD